MRASIKIRPPQTYAWHYRLHNRYYLTDEWQDLRFAVLKRDDNICQYCGMYGVQADHIYPRKYGGEDSLDNLVCCCSTCNRIAMNEIFHCFHCKRDFIRDQRMYLGYPVGDY